MWFEFRLCHLLPLITSLSMFARLQSRGINRTSLRGLRLGKIIDVMHSAACCARARGHCYCDSENRPTPLLGGSWREQGANICGAPTVRGTLSLFYKS